MARERAAARPLRPAGLAALAARLVRRAARPPVREAGPGPGRGAAPGSGPAEEPRAGAHGAAAPATAPATARAAPPAPAAPERDARYEVKAVCEERSWPLVRTHLLLHAAGLRTLYPPRRVQSVYLDTHEGRALEENLAGITHREKLRYRWYGDATRGVRGTLEKKVRENRLGWKELLPVPEPFDVEGAPRTRLGELLHRHASPAWREALAGAEPAQWVSYRREYLATPDGRVRVTVDRELRAFDQRFVPALTSRFATPLPRLVVVEFKSSAAEYADLRDLVASFPLVMDRCSKFVLASSPVNGPVMSALDP